MKLPHLKLLWYANYLDVPDHCANKYNVTTAGNPFSDKKSAHVLIEGIIMHRNYITPRDVAVRVRDANGCIMCAYVVDVP